MARVAVEGSTEEEDSLSPTQAVHDNLVGSRATFSSLDATQGKETTTTTVMTRTTSTRIRKVTQTGNKDGERQAQEVPSMGRDTVGGWVEAVARWQTSAKQNRRDWWECFAESGSYFLGRSFSFPHTSWARYRS